MAVAVCGAVERSPGYAALAGLLDKLFGKAVGNAFRAPFVLGDPGDLRKIAAAAGLEGASVREQTGAVHFHSIAELVSTERACVWTLGGILDPDQFDLLLREAEPVLRPFAEPHGTVVFDMPALFLEACKVT